MQLREIELKVQREISEKRQELLAKEQTLRYVSAVTLPDTASDVSTEISRAASPLRDPFGSCKVAIWLPLHRL